MFGLELTGNPADVEQFAPPGVWPLVQEDYIIPVGWLSNEDNQEAGYFCFLERRDHLRSDAGGTR